MRATLSLFIISTLVSLAGCASTRSTLPDGPITVDSLQQLQQLGNESTHNNIGISSIRLQALQDTALSLGAQAGLAMRSQQLNELLAQREKTLDPVFNFNAMLLSNNVIPPVLVEGKDELNLDNADTIRLADRTVRIAKQAHFVTTAPTWRDYLMMSYAKPSAPSSTLLPKNNAESAVWHQSIQQGWQEGIQQADNIYAENLARLKRDYTGMILYRKLLAEHMVSAPFVAKSNLGVTGSSSSIRINDQVLRITAVPALNTNSKTWKPILSH